MLAVRGVPSMRCNTASSCKVSSAKAILTPSRRKVSSAVASPARSSLSDRRHASRSTILCAAGSSPVGMNPELKSSIDELITSNKVVVFMKGTRQFPQCGFSNNVVQILNVMSVPYETVNILADDRLRTGMKEYSQWPTFPQVYINGEFFGGCDIMIQAYQSGELKEQLEIALNS